MLIALFLLKKKTFIFNYMYVCIGGGLCTCEDRCLQRPERVLDFPEAVVMGTGDEAWVLCKSNKYP